MPENLFFYQARC